MFHQISSSCSIKALFNLFSCTYPHASTTCLQSKTATPSQKQPILPQRLSASALPISVKCQSHHTHPEHSNTRSHSPTTPLLHWIQVENLQIQQRTLQKQSHTFRHHCIKPVNNPAIPVMKSCVLCFVNVACYIC